jgi:DNA-binding transcriptional LysR family regulator
VGVIRLSYTTTAAIVDLPLLLKQAAALLPDVKILLWESSSAAQKDALLANMLDVGILRPPIDRAKFGAITMRKEHFIAALHKDDPRTKKNRLTIQDFDGQNFIMYSPDDASYSYRALTALFDQARVTPVMVQHIGQNLAILSLVSAGMGAALLPESLSRLALPDLVFRIVCIDVPHSPLEMHMLWRPQNENPVLPSFLRFCKALFDQPSVQKTHRMT